MKKLILLCMVVCGLTYSQTLFAQREVKSQAAVVQSTTSSESQADDKLKFNSLLQELEGTYQFQVNKNDYQPLFSLSLLERIRDSRSENTTVYIDIDQYTKLIIPSKSEIVSGDFQKLERIKLISKD